MKSFIYGFAAGAATLYFGVGLYIRFSGNDYNVYYRQSTNIISIEVLEKK